MLRLSARLLLLAASLVLCGAGAELWLRGQSVALEDDSREFAPYRNDVAVGYRLKADYHGVHRHPDYRVHVTTNSLGLRGPPATARKASGVYRVLVLGDSYAFGFGVEDHESFPARLAARLRGSSPRVEVLNAGVPGYAADHYLVTLRTRGFALEPDLVIVACYQNDVEDLAWSALVLDEDRLPTRTQSTLRMIDRKGRMRYLPASGVALPGWIRDPPETLQAHSALFNWVRYRVARLWVGRARRERLDASPPSAPEGPIPLLSAEEIARGLASGDDFRQRYHAHLLDGLEREARDRGIPLQIVALASHAGRVADDCRARPGCLDLSELFTRERNPDYFHPTDGHYTARGHARIAEALAAKLLPLPDH